MSDDPKLPIPNNQPPAWWYVTLVLIIVAALIVTPAILTMGVHLK